MPRLRSASARAVGGIQRKGLISRVEDHEIVAEAVHFEERCHEAAYIGCDAAAHQWRLDHSALRDGGLCHPREDRMRRFAILLMGLLAATAA